MEQRCVRHKSDVNKSTEYIENQISLVYKDQLLHITEIINVDEGDFALTFISTSWENINGKNDILK